MVLILSPVPCSVHEQILQWLILENLHEIDRAVYTRNLWFDCDYNSFNLPSLACYNYSHLALNHFNSYLNYVYPIT